MKNLDRFDFTVDMTFDLNYAPNADPDHHFPHQLTRKDTNETVARVSNLDLVIALAAIWNERLKLQNAEPVVSMADLQALADDVVLEHSTGNSDIFTEKLRRLIAGIRSIECAAPASPIVPAGAAAPIIRTSGIVSAEAQRKGNPHALGQQIAAVLAENNTCPQCHCPIDAHAFDCLFNPNNIDQEPAP